MTSRLTGYDLVAALTENTINVQIQRLWSIGAIKKRWSVEFEVWGMSCTLDITRMESPYALFSFDDSDYHDVVLVLPLHEGTFTGPDKKPIAVKDWQFAFKTNVSLDKMSKDTLDERIAKGTTPKAVRDAIEQTGLHLDVVFEMSQIFMDFENANFAQFDKKHTKIDLSALPEKDRANAMSALVDALTAYFQGLAGTANPYVLGYPLATTHQRTPSSEPPTFIPTSVAFSTTPNKEGLGSLNFLFMTDGRDKGGSGIFNPPLVTSDKADGVFAVDSQLLLSQLIPPLLSQFGDFTIKDFNRGDGGGYKLDAGKVTKGDLKDGSLDVKIWSEGEKPTLKVEFKYWLTKEAKLLHIIPDGTYTMTATWNITFEFKTDDKGKISGTVKESTKPDVTIDTKKAWWAYLLDVLFPSVGITDAIVVHMVDLKSFPNVSDGVWDAGSAKLTLVMPAGEVFLFKNSRFDGQEDLFVDITYNT